MVKNLGYSVFIMTCVHSWNDPRIFYKEAVSLAKNYRVELHAPAEFKFHEVQGVGVFGLPSYKKRYLRPLNWFRLAFRIWKSKAGVVHFHDPELIILGFFLTLFTRKKIIYDVHEDIPASILTKPWIYPSLRRTLSWMAGVCERNCAKRFDALILAETSYQKNFIIPDVLQEEILNYPLTGVFRTGIRKKRNKRKVTLVYAGGISESRGIWEMVESLFLLKKAGVWFHCYLVGTWVPPLLRTEIQARIIEYKLDKWMTVTGKIPLNEVFDIYRKADIGLALLHPEQNYIHSLATKIFEYMAAGVPVVASNFSLWQGLISNNCCGVTTDPLNVQEIFQKILFLVYNPALRKAMGENGYRAFCQSYNWRTEERKLLKVYEGLIGKSRSKSMIEKSQKNKQEAQANGDRNSGGAL